MNQNQCSICEGNNVPLKPDTTTGRLRGYLCSECTNLISYISANGWWLSQCLNYLGLAR